MEIGSKLFEYGIAVGVLIWFMWIVYPRLRGIEVKLDLLIRAIHLLTVATSIDHKETLKDQADQIKKELDKQNENH